MEISKQAKKAAMDEDANFYYRRHPESVSHKGIKIKDNGFYVQQLLNSTLQEKDAEIGRLKERCEHWIKDAQDAVNGVYGSNPKGEPEDYWRGRVAALTDLHAFIPPTKF